MAEKQRFKILFLTQQQFNDLLEYSATNPTGTTEGKRWRRNLNERPRSISKTPEWVVCEYGKPFVDPKQRPNRKPTDELLYLSPIHYYAPVIIGHTHEPAQVR